MLITVLFSNDEILDSGFLDKCQKTSNSLGLSKVQTILEKYHSRSFTRRTPFPAKLFKFLVVAVVIIVLIVTVMVALLKW